MEGRVRGWKTETDGTHFSLRLLKTRTDTGRHWTVVSISKNKLFVFCEKKIFFINFGEKTFTPFHLLENESQTH